MCEKSLETVEVKNSKHTFGNNDPANKGVFSSEGQKIRHCSAAEKPISQGLSSVSLSPETCAAAEEKPDALKRGMISTVIRVWMFVGGLFRLH